MYRCHVCGVCSVPGQKRLTHCVYRTVPKVVPVLTPSGRCVGHESVEGTREEIAKELSVCPTCAMFMYM